MGFVLAQPIFPGSRLRLPLGSDVGVGDRRSRQAFRLCRHAARLLKPLETLHDQTHHQHCRHRA